jgi:curved DNA-binding protein CbpA
MTLDRRPLYAVLDIEQDADRQRVREAYRETVKEHHPDVADHDDAQELFVWVTRAKSVLTDASERKRYDRIGHARYCEREGWTSSSCSARAVVETYWGPFDDGGGRDEDATVASDSVGPAHGTDAGPGEERRSEKATPSSPHGRTSPSEHSTTPGTRSEPSRTRARASGAGTGSTHPAAFGGDNLYYRNIAHVHATHRPSEGVGIQWAPFVAIGVTLAVLFGSFAVVVLYLG